MTEKNISRTVTNPKERRQLLLDKLEAELQDVINRLADLIFVLREESSEQSKMTDDEYASADSHARTLAQLRDTLTHRIEAIRGGQGTPLVR